VNSSKLGKFPEDTWNVIRKWSKNKKVEESGGGNFSPPLLKNSKFSLQMPNTPLI